MTSIYFICLVFVFLILSFLYILLLAPTTYTIVLSQDSEQVVQDIQRRSIGHRSCKSGNPIDDCWRCDDDWANNREQLADCAIGFGGQATGGKGGKIYLVTNSSDRDSPGTLRHAVTQNESLWIIFKHDMVITLKKNLYIKSNKTIDGRGANVHMTGRRCISIRQATNVIIHGIHIHDCCGDGISIRTSNHVWVDHCSLSNCTDGLIDVTRGSTYITLSNNHMTHHNKVMLLGHKDSYVKDRNMQVTIAFNHFGEGLVQRMPRCRHGYFHIVNNDYTHWKKYAIGGSASPTIFSQGNRFLASNNSSIKGVTKHMNASVNEWRKWNWTSRGDLMLNGAFFFQSGAKDISSYNKACSFRARPSHLVGLITKDAGALNCNEGSPC